MPEKSLKVVSFGCTHHPLQDPIAIDWLLGLIGREKPDLIVHHGDGIESNAASQWDDAKELGIPLEDEFVALNKFLADVRKARPNARRKYLPGNHEANILRAGRIDKRIRSLVDWRNQRNVPELANWELGQDYNYSRSRGSFSVGQMCFAHGYETAATKTALEAMYFTKNSPFSVYITAHTHRPKPVTPIVWGTLPMDRWEANVGCLRDMEPSYMERNRKWQWGQAAFVGEVMPLKSPRMAREWDGRVEVFRMYDEAA